MKRFISIFTVGIILAGCASTPTAPAPPVMPSNQFYTGSVNQPVQAIATSAIPTSVTLPTAPPIALKFDGSYLYGQADPCEYLAGIGIPILTSESIQQTFGAAITSVTLFTDQERVRLAGKRLRACGILSEAIRQGYFTEAELRHEGAYITVDPSDFSLDQIHELATMLPTTAPTFTPPHPYAWFNTSVTNYTNNVSLTGGVAIRFARPFASGLSWPDQMEALREYSRDKGIPFAPTTAMEEVMIRLSDPRAHTPQAIMWGPPTRAYIPGGPTLIVGYLAAQHFPVFVEEDDGKIRYGVIRQWKDPI